MSADVVIPQTMVSPTIAGIGGFPERVMAEYVLGLAGSGGCRVAPGGEERQTRFL